MHGAPPIAVVPPPLAVTPSANVILLVGFIVVSGTALILWRRHGEITTTQPPQSSDDANPVDAEPVTDTDRIIALLKDHGGRMHQSDIVAHTGWSKSKVSVKLSDMADNGHVQKLRLGRENIISLPGHEPHPVDPPTDE